MKMNYKKILVQDDCTPRESEEVFAREFKKLMGCTVLDFRNAAERSDIDDGYITEYKLLGYRLSICAGDPWWVLEREIQAGGAQERYDKAKEWIGKQEYTSNILVVEAQVDKLIRIASGLEIAKW